jgi:hypothetical protein
MDDHLHYGPFVTFPTGEFLSVDTMHEFILPFQGWYYFETMEEAKNFFNIND